MREVYVANVAAPIDPTQLPEWAKLSEDYREMQEKGISLKQWFADDPERVQKLSFDVNDLHFDLSKNLVTDEVIKDLVALGRAVKLEERRDQMLSGVHINTTEDRAVLHSALRRPASDEGKLIVDGQDCVKDVHEVLDRMYAFAEKVRSGEWKGVTGKKIENVVSIGIGGSALRARSWSTRRCVRTPTLASRCATSPTSTRMMLPRSSRAWIPRPRL